MSGSVRTKKANGDPVVAELKAIKDLQLKAKIEPVVAELKAIKRLLALMLVRDGAPQNPVAKAAGIRAETINQFAKAVRSSKQHNGRLKD